MPSSSARSHAATAKPAPGGGSQAEFEPGLPPGSDYRGRELMLLLQGFTTETDRYIEALGHKYGMHRTDLNALTAVIDAQREGRSITPGVLGGQLSLSSAATTALVDRLSKVGHMVRSRSGPDRRQVQLEVTDSARLRGSEIFTPMVEELLGVVARRSPEEIELLSTFMEELRDALVRAREKALAQSAKRSGDASASSGS
ncbi:MarR family transcriptional regulator [Arthrobacter crystallopoietes BAB-32]|uniref:MarR family transcriptional regulator n=1 Tax=Arthrobacter crystallopoietes BAB-32 TaxID=1246476 RepID=N1UQI8_9MICC|nr:MarR family transcriptional regulator [Arthrobacter crystallopoietes]EMY32656.1 MarR family transcriptional regulator [Arthrobacter crystallopoietes BAB-32]